MRVYKRSIGKFADQFGPKSEMAKKVAKKTKKLVRETLPRAEEAPGFRPGPRPRNWCLLALSRARALLYPKLGTLDCEFRIDRLFDSRISPQTRAISFQNGIWIRGEARVYTRAPAPP